MKICALGATTSAHVLARAAIFRKFGHEVTMISASPMESNPGIRTIACSRKELGRLVWLFQTVRRARADVYHAHYAAEPTTWACWLLRKHPFVVTVLRANVSWIWCGVLDARVFKPDAQGALQRRTEWGCGAHDKILFSPRMLKPLYNQVLMVEALALVPDAKLVLSTYNEDLGYRAEVEAKARELGVTERVVLVPAVQPSEMVASYSAADVVLSLPPSDGTPQSVMEAMACATPVVMTDLERFKPFFTHNQTVWFAALKAQGVAAAIAALLGGRAAPIAAAARDWVREHADFETQARALERRLMDL